MGHEQQLAAVQQLPHAESHRLGFGHSLFLPLEADAGLASPAGPRGGIGSLPLPFGNGRCPAGPQRSANSAKSSTSPRRRGFGDSANRSRVVILILRESCRQRWTDHRPSSVSPGSSSPSICSRGQSRVACRAKVWWLQCGQCGTDSKRCAANRLYKTRRT